MKENIKVHGQLRGYLSWPLLLSLFMICANIAAGCVSHIGGLIMLPFTIGYLHCHVDFLLQQKEDSGGLVDFSAEYAWIQKQLLTGLALPYALADEDGRIVWANDEFQAVTALEKGKWKNLLSMFPEATKDDLATDEDPVKVHTVFGERRFRMEIQPIYVSSSEQEEIQAVISDRSFWLSICLMKRKFCVTVSRSPMRRWWQASFIWTTMTRRLRALKRCAAPC